MTFHGTWCVDMNTHAEHCACFVFIGICYLSTSPVIFKTKMIYMHLVSLMIISCIGYKWLPFLFEHYNDIIMGVMASQVTSLTIVYSAVYSGADQRKHQSFASLAFARGIHRWPVNSPHKWPVTRKMSPFDDVIMIISYVTYTITTALLNIPCCTQKTLWLWYFSCIHTLFQIFTCCFLQDERSQVLTTTGLVIAVSDFLLYLTPDTLIDPIEKTTLKNHCEYFDQYQAISV